MSYEPADPWASFYSGGDDLPYAAPGFINHLRAQQRAEERAERAREERERAERAERAEERRELRMLRRMAELSWAGQSFDPSDPRTLARGHAEFVLETFASMDLADARAERAALIRSGELHLLGPAYPESSPSAAEVATPLPPSSAARTGMRAKITELLHRGNGPIPCCCVSCVSVRANRGA